MTNWRPSAPPIFDNTSIFSRPIHSKAAIRQARSWIAPRGFPRPSLFEGSPDLIKINEEENQSVGFKLDYSIGQYHNRSDQYNFARRKIPFLFYFTGLHGDYHTEEICGCKNFFKLLSVCLLLS